MSNVLKLQIYETRRWISGKEMVKFCTISKVELANRSHNPPATVFLDNFPNKVADHLLCSASPGGIESINHQEGGFQSQPVLKYLGQLVLQSEFFPELTQTLRGESIHG